MKILVTHFSPDLDAIAGIWLIKKFLPGWERAEIKFVPAGETWEDQPVDSDPDILHIDTGFGKFDHHQTDEETCSAKRILAELKIEKRAKARSSGIEKCKNDEALERLVEVINDIDHFQEVYFPNPTADFYNLGLVSQLDGRKLLYPDDNPRLVEFGCASLDGIYKQLQSKVWAEKLLKEEGIEFETRFGKAIGIQTGNDEVVHTGQKQGYVLVVRKDGKKGYVRIKSLPDPKIDLTGVVEKLKEKDPQASWFLHIDKHQILNGSTKNPKMKPTKLSLREIIEIIKNG
ncbi:MAG: hypothetical protein LiPW16_261 [Microgenomates group bacterium LiPW_16]|nr:MAG: hypothetical protein LiPW16_261 [Microgenomates group bacterium LiPW_16]